MFLGKYTGTETAGVRKDLGPASSRTNTVDFFSRSIPSRLSAVSALEWGADRRAAAKIAKYATELSSVSIDCDAFLEMR